MREKICRVKNHFNATYVNSWHRSHDIEKYDMVLTIDNNQIKK